MSFGTNGLKALRVPLDGLGLLLELWERAAALALCFLFYSWFVQAPSVDGADPASMTSH